MRLLVIRHGETVQNLAGILQGHTDGNLSCKGRIQAEKLRERLKGTAIDAVYSSDLGRAKETAAIIAEGLGLPVIADQRLRERDYGMHTGKVVKQLNSDNPGWDQHPSVEKKTKIEERAKSFLSDIISKSYDTVAIVSHGSYLSVLVGMLLGKSADECREYRLDNASVTEFIIDERPFLRLFNCTKHLR